MPYAQAGKVRLYYESFGRGVPFLFVSGTGWPGEPWKLKQVRAFTDRYQVIVYDHRGVGKSNAPAGYYSTRQFAQDAATLAALHDLVPFSIVCRFRPAQRL